MKFSTSIDSALVWLAIACALVVAGHAQANDANAPAPAVSGPFARPVSTDHLSAQRGRADIRTNEQLTNGTVSNNVAQRVTTGSNTITEGSFSNAAGLPIVVQNTGNNVLIQNSTILNVNVK